MPPLDTHLTKLELNALGGDPQAQHNLGLILLKKKDTKIALKWLMKSALADYPPAQYFFGLYYHQQKNLDEAKHWYDLAAEQGHERSKHHLERLSSSK